MEKIVGSLVGVVVGFLLSQLAGFMRESATKKKERNDRGRSLDYKFPN
jgi:hypothetical protein